MNPNSNKDPTRIIFLSVIQNDVPPRRIVQFLYYNSETVVSFRVVVPSWLINICSIDRHTAILKSSELDHFDLIPFVV